MRALGASFEKLQQLIVRVEVFAGQVVEQQSVDTPFAVEQRRLATFSAGVATIMKNNRTIEIALCTPSKIFESGASDKTLRPGRRIARLVHHTVDSISAESQSSANVGSVVA